MSGGEFDYIQYTIDGTADKLESIILVNDEYSSATIDQFRIGLHHLRLAAIYLHRIDYLVSCDDSEDSFHSRLQEELNAYNARYNQAGAG